MPVFLDLDGCNVGLRHWHPTPVTQNGDHLAGQGELGGVWEWTSTPLMPHDGFKAMEVYPGYTCESELWTLDSIANYLSLQVKLTTSQRTSSMESTTLYWVALGLLIHGLRAEQPCESSSRVLFIYKPVH